MGQPSTESSTHSPALYAWYLHPQMLDALFDETSRSALRRIAHRYLGRGDHLAYTRELELWLRRHPVDPLDVAVVSGRCAPGRLVWSELDFEWSEVSSQRRRARAGDAEVRCSFTGTMRLDDGSTMRVHGTFNPGWVTAARPTPNCVGVDDSMCSATSLR